MTRAPALALDLTRLALAPVRRAPRGIDRVELAYARHFLNSWPGECYPVLPMPWGVRCYRRSQGIEFLRAIEDLWGEAKQNPEDHVYARTKAFLTGTAEPPHKALAGVKPSLFEQAGGFLKLLSVTGVPFGRPIARTLPSDAVYLNVGQLEVFRPFLRWLHRRPDVRAVFMIHDLIPLEYPEHHLQIGIRMHERIVRNTAEFAHALIVPSHAVSRSVSLELSKFGRDSIRTHVEHLAVAPEFLEPVAPDPQLSGTNYCVICGAVDSYKNHMLLLQVWKELVARHGGAAPKLVIAGGPGVSGGHVIAFLRDTPELADHVFFASGLSTGSLRQVMLNAKALLMPSLAEGFGLPIIEALAQGTPVLASDIPAHREAGVGGNVTYLAALEREAWLKSIEAASALVRSPDGKAVPGAGVYAPRTWETYFAGIKKLLADLANERQTATAAS